MTETIQHLLNTARLEVGTKEVPIGSNWGPRVREYLAAAGVKSPAPWCMAFVCWCFRRAFPEQRDFPTTASCTFLLNWAKEQHRLHNRPEPGDVFLLLRPGGKTAFHTGFITAVGPLTIQTLEGNSNPGGSPEGFEVVRRSRRWRLSRIAFVRIED